MFYSTCSKFLKRRVSSPAVVYIMLVVLLIGLTGLPLVQAQEDLTPAPTGPYQIGTVSYHWIDASREETLTPEEDDQREVIVQFWYPAEVAAGETATEYMSNAEDIMSTLNTVLSDAGRDITVTGADLAGYQSHAFANAPLADGEETYPVLIFSPFILGVPEGYATQLEELASHGYIVAGIIHPYITTFTFLADGRTAVFANVEEYTASAIVTQDEIFVLDQLEILNADDPEDVFTSRLDLDHIGIFGHGTGGGASVQTCYLDSRCKAGADENGDVNGTVAIDGFDQPFMFFSNEGETFTTSLAYRKARGPVYALRVTGMQYLTFTDFPFWPASALVNGPETLGEIEPERSVQIMRTYMLAFFDQYLKGKTSELLEGVSDEYPEVNIEMKNT